MSDTADTANTADTAAGEPLLQAHGLTKTFRVPRSASGSTRLHALDGVDLTVRRGETLGLVGESGCGKSTLARVLLMLERPDAGTVRYDGVDPSRCAASRCWPGAAGCRWSSRTRSPP